MAPTHLMKSHPPPSRWLFLSHPIPFFFIGCNTVHLSLIIRRVNISPFLSQQVEKISPAFVKLPSPARRIQPLIRDSLCHIFQDPRIKRLRGFLRRFFDQGYIFPECSHSDSILGRRIAQRCAFRHSIIHYSL